MTELPSLTDLIQPEVTCPDCQSANIGKSGFVGVKQRYRCNSTDCETQTFVLDPATPGPKLKGKKKLTNAERQKAFRDRQKAKKSGKLSA